MQKLNDEEDTKLEEEIEEVTRMEAYYKEGLDQGKWLKRARLV